MHPQLHELLAEFIKDHITQVLHLCVHVALPLYPLIVRLAQNVKLNKVLVACEESQPLEQLGPRHQLIIICLVIVVGATHHCCCCCWFIVIIIVMIIIIIIITIMTMTMMWWFQRC